MMKPLWTLMMFLSLGISAEAQQNRLPCKAQIKKASAASFSVQHTANVRDLNVAEDDSATVIEFSMSRQSIEAAVFLRSKENPSEILIMALPSNFIYEGQFIMAVDLRIQYPDRPMHQALVWYVPGPNPVVMNARAFTGISQIELQCLMEKPQSL